MAFIKADMDLVNTSIFHKWKYYLRALTRVNHEKKHYKESEVLESKS
jgi:hypothetical protein